MSGTIPLSMTQQFDVYGKPLAGGQLYLIQAGTVSTPQNGFQDSALTIPLPNPITLDAAGRIPQFFLADGSIKVRLQDKTGVVQLASDNILVIGPSAGGGGGATVDPTTLIQMGNMIARYGVGVLTGYVRANAMTIGSATSGGTERANADCQALFQYLWGVDTSLAVSGGRGATAAADWAANKQLTLPDWRGYAMSALDDMGNAAAGRLGSFANPTVLGSAGGTPSLTLVAANLPAHVHSAAPGSKTEAEDATHSHQVPGVIAPQVGSSVGMGTGGVAVALATQNIQTGTQSASHKHPFTFTTDGGAGLLGTPVSIIDPRKLCTFYIKL